MIGEVDVDAHIGECGEVLTLGIVEAEHISQRRDHRSRRITIASALQPDKIFDADPGETGHLLTTQAWRTPWADRPQTERRRVDALAAGAQELTECGHSESLGSQRSAAR